MNDRIEVLKSILAQKPEDRFARYGLAMEYGKAGRHEEAVAEFERLIAEDPGYSYAYFHCGQSLEKLGRVEDARQVYRRGIDAAPDPHARSELQGALDLLG
jgi:tetratricopeptide (TPR) repeat protein